MTKFYLLLLDLCKPLFNSLGVNYPQLRAIVEVKLKMDNRRTRLNYRGESKKESNYSFVLTLLVHFLFGAIFGFFIILSQNIIGIFAFSFAYTMFMMMMTLITDFSQVILDSNDNAVLLPRPVDDRTLLTARIVHILIYLFSMMLASSLPSLIATAYKYGFGVALIFLIISVLGMVLVVFLTNLLYLILMRFTSEEKLRNIINGFQIFITIILMGGYRIIGRLINFEDLTQNLQVKIEWWNYLAPPVWMGHTMGAFINKDFGQQNLIFIALILTMPFVVMFIVNKYFAGIFSNRLATMDISKKEIIKPSTQKANGLITRLAQLFTKTPIEKGTFELVWKITNRDRKFKLRTYPSLAYLLFYFPLMMMGSDNSSFTESIADLENRKGMMIFMIYFAATIITTIRSQIAYSDYYKAAWIYQISPIYKPGEVLSGMFKAVLTKFVAPIFIILSIIVSLIWGIETLDDVIFAGLAIVILDLGYIIGTKNDLPFSTEVRQNAGGNFVRVLLYGIVTSLVGLVHWGMMQFSYIVIILIPIQLVLLWYLFREIRAVGWDKVTQ
jgi:ABC-2 type transport system permease protein